MQILEDFVSREASKKIQEYKNLLIKWNKTINLVSSKTLDDILERHILDSIQLLNYIKNKDIVIIDIGSGGGFPGIILSIGGIKKITLIESDSRKAAFLLQASKISSNRVEVKNTRVEDVVNSECDILTSRAFSDLNSIFNYTNNIKVKDKYLLHKGRSYKQEIQNAKKHWLFKINVHDSITSKQGKILEIEDVISRI